MRKTMIPLLAATALIPGGVSTAAPAQTIAIMGATVFDGTGAAPYPANVIVTDGRIVAVGANIKAPVGARIVDAKGKALLPGFFDLHTHWGSGEPATIPQVATAYIKAGVTTVNDFASAPEAFAPRRAWIASLASPHVLYAARMGVPGGHGATWGDESTTALATTPEAAKLVIDNLVSYQPDLIKIFTDGWRYGIAPNNMSMNEDAVAAIVQGARAHNWPVMTHTVTVERGLEAARAGVTSLAHGIQDRKLTADEVTRISRTGMGMAPTLAVYDSNKPGGIPMTDGHDDREQNARKFSYALYNVKVLHDAGVPIALGTDAGMPRTPHGVSTLREMELFVQAGMTPTQALMSGTSVSARIIGLQDDRGVIAPGKRADIVLIDGAPWANIRDVYKVSQVYIDGKQVVGKGAPPLPAANLATRLESAKVGSMIDDFERPDGRSSLDTLRVETPDGGLDRTVEVTQLVPRDDGHALLLSGRMARKNDPFAGIAIPLTRGSVRPVDLRGYKGVRLDIKGAGDYMFKVNGLDGSWLAPIATGSDWRTVEIPFVQLQKMSRDGRFMPDGKWTGDGLTQVELMAKGSAGTRLWVQIDNIRFY